MQYKIKDTIHEEVKAFRYDGDLMNSSGAHYVPDWAVEAHENGILVYGEDTSGPGVLFLETEDGQESIEVGNYIIQTENGIAYMKEDVFLELYERTIGD